MKTKDISALREKSVVDLLVEVEKLRKELTVTKMQFAVGRLAKSHLLKALRQKIAIIQTIVTEKNTVQA